MVWRVQSVSEGPVVLNDIGFIFTKGAIRDLDLIGRENAEKSNDIKLALQKGWLKELEKSGRPSLPESPALDSGLIDKLNESINKANATVAQTEQVSAAQQAMIAKLEENNSKLQAQLQAQQQKLDNQETQMSVLVSKSDAILAEVKALFDKDPIGTRTMLEALKNIKSERADIKEAMETTGDSEQEIAASHKILEMRDKKLEKNADQIGKSLSKDSESLDDMVDDLDEIFG